MISLIVTLAKCQTSDPRIFFASPPAGLGSEVISVRPCVSNRCILLAGGGYDFWAVTRQPMEPQTYANLSCLMENTMFGLYLTKAMVCFGVLASPGILHIGTHFGTGVERGEEDPSLGFRFARHGRRPCCNTSERPRAASGAARGAPVFLGRTIGWWWVVAVDGGGGGGGGG